jgi:uroporphyrinogen III methyltransferase/synthase
MVEEAKAGKIVVRLKGGDPAIFGRGAEEAEALAAEKIPFEIIPGVTAAGAAMAYAGIPLTHRDYASAVALVTGHEKEDEPDSMSLDYAALARFPGTLVVYMGVTTAERWVRQLIRGGKNSATPAAIVRHCSLPDQQTITCALADVPQHLSDQHIRPPVVVIIGDVVRLSSKLSWYERLPLFGRRILVTRPKHQAAELCDRFEKLGAHVLCQPAIEIGPPHDWSAVDGAIKELHSFDWIVFSSANGVTYFLGRLQHLGLDWRALGRTRIAAIGPGTEAQLASSGLKADLVPPTFVAESLAEALAASTAGKRVLLVRASRGREVLAERLHACGAQVVQVVTYQSTDVQHPAETIVEQLAAHRVHWITVTSSAIAHSLKRMFGETLRNSRLVSISPITSAELRRLGFEPAAEATEQTMQGVADAVVKAETRT